MKNEIPSESRGNSKFEVRLDAQSYDPVSDEELELPTKEMAYIEVWYEPEKKYVAGLLHAFSGEWKADEYLGSMPRFEVSLEFVAYLKDGKLPNLKRELSRSK